MNGTRAPATPSASSRSRVLIACDDDLLAGELQITLHSAGLKSARTTSVRTARKHVGSGNFLVVFTVPILPDGSWPNLLEFARSRNLAPAFVVIARSFDLHEWGESFRNGAFDVLDALSEIPKAPEVASQALARPMSTPPQFSFAPSESQRSHSPAHRSE